MSAIVGVLYLDGRSVDVITIQLMMERLAHRGLDATGTWHDISVGFGQGTLWTTPESRGEGHPFIVRKGELAITADARIDNRDELVNKLKLSSIKITGFTDSELILEAYQKWGIDCPQHLVGDFAFAVWDKKNRTLYCACDHMGVKPFYYFHSPKLFAFASEIKGLLCIPEIPKQLNEVHLGEHLALYPGRSSTYYQDIFHLPGGHSLLVSRDGFRVWRYWTYESIHQVNLRNDQEYLAAFLDVFKNAVRCRLRSDYLVGSSLSGGLDSSSIACMARDLYQHREGTALHTFSAIFPSIPERKRRVIDERKFMTAVLDQGGFTHHWIEADRLSPMTDAIHLLWEDDEPIGAPNLYMHVAMYRAAQESGVRVFLDGIDGDTAISHGYQYLTELASQGRWIKLVRESAAIAKGTRNYPSAIRRIVLKYGFKPLTPGAIVRIFRSMRGVDIPSITILNAIHPDFAERIKLIERLKDVQETSWRGAMREHWDNINHAVNAYILNIANKASVRYAIEGRYPFFDRRLLEFMIGIPARLKLRNGWTRYIHRQAMEGILPPEIQWRRSKSNLTPNFQRQFLRAAHDELDLLLNQDNDLLQPYLDFDVLKEYYQAYRAQPMGVPHAALIIFRAYILAKWLKNTWH